MEINQTTDVPAAVRLASDTAARSADTTSTLLVGSAMKGRVAPHKLPGKRIFLAEDDYLLAFDLCNEFMRHGADVIGPASTLDFALQLAASELPIDAAVVDINLHGEFTYHLVDELVRLDIPVVFSSGYNGEVLPYRLRHIPLYTKPIPTSDIVEGVAGLI